jgi:hypothetical protein
MSLVELLPGDMTPVDALRGVQSLLQTEPEKKTRLKGALSGVGRVGVHKHPMAQHHFSDSKRR